MRKEVKNWDAPLTGCVVVFVFEEISLMVFSINKGSFKFYIASGRFIAVCGE